MSNIMSRLAPHAVGPPRTCGWWHGEPVWFDADGGPHTLRDVRHALDALVFQREDLARALAEMDCGIVRRRDLIAELAQMAARGE